MKLMIGATLAFVALLVGVVVFTTGVSAPAERVVPAEQVFRGDLTIKSPGNTAPNTPEIPPPLPTYITGGDGGRLNCAPNYEFCWPEPGQN